MLSNTTANQLAEALRRIHKASMTKTEASKSAAKLNKEQRTALECLKRNGHHAGQWLIGGSVRTRRVLRELVQLGLAVERQERNILGPYVAFYPVRNGGAA